MKSYSPSHLTPRESRERINSDEERAINVSDVTLKQYAEGVIHHYRAVIERHFEQLAPYLAFYRQHPYQVTVVRVGQNGTFIGYKPNISSSVTVIRLDELKPPLKQINLFDLQDRLQANLVTFDFSPRTYDESEAEIYGTRMALADALHFLWLGIDAVTFEKLCIDLLEAEGLTDEVDVGEFYSVDFDTVREATLEEPGGFRRVEQWAFEFKHHQDNRVSAKYLHEIETQFEYHGPTAEVFCLITSGDLTTIGRSIAVKHPRVRVWDRDVLNRLVNKHLSILEKYFSPYPAAIKVLTEQLNRAAESRYAEFERRLAACPAGLKHFVAYENIGTELWQYVFEGKLGPPRVQKTTSDRVQRRDSLFQNLRTSRFFQRVFDRFDADFVIVDFKNHKHPVASGPIDEVRNYANKALGNFVVLVTRRGAASAAAAAQIRLLRDGIAVIAMSDAQMLEMISRKERGEDPEDVLSDLLDDLLVRF